MAGLAGIVNREGHPKCRHEQVSYSWHRDGPQAYWCDREGCGRKVTLPYDPAHAGEMLALPPNSLVSCQGFPDGSERWYTFRTDGAGQLRELPRSRWARRLAG